MEKKDINSKVKKCKNKRIKNKRIKNKKKKELKFPINDGRMFTNDLLYCEGRHRPLLRGFVHLLGLCSGMIPIGLFEIIKISNNDTIMITLACLFFICNFICYFVSALFHILDWPANVEIVLQKIDHIMCCVYCVSTLLLWSYALFPFKIQIPLAIVSIILLIINIYKILSHEPSLVIQALTGLVSLLYIPFFYAYSTKREFALCGIVLFLCYFGVVIFIQELDLPFINNNIIGHHEIFHMMLALVGIIGYFMLHSIITRKCNGIACE
jgi:predicted membrane channel-forming protein YqfA (hemolysin III family)